MLSAKQWSNFWYTRSGWRWLLWPLAFFYQNVVRMRAYYLQRFKQRVFNVPIIVVGNITVGGVGKTPLVIALAKQLQDRGLTVGIVSRGYGATVRAFPHEVCPDDTACKVGDEPQLLAQKTKCPVVIAPNRVDAVQYLLDKYACQVIISDDGLQHYAMGRAIEIAVIDGAREFGNGLCLPAGPLREPVDRLKRVDFIVMNGRCANAPRFETQFGKIMHGMELRPEGLRQLLTGKPVIIEQLTSPVAAIAGIGHPQRFFDTLTRLGIVFNPYPFADHFSFKPQDLCVSEKTVVMTEKDAVKCYPFATDKMYFLPVNAHVCEDFWLALWSHQHLKGYI